MDPHNGGAHDPEAWSGPAGPSGPLEPRQGPNPLPARAAGGASVPPASRTPRPARGSDDRAASTGSPARTFEIVAGDFLLTVNPIDGSEVQRCPADARPLPGRLSARARADRQRAAQAPSLAGRLDAPQPLLEREEQRDRLTRLLTRGRSIRLTGPSGSGRSALLSAVADGCADIAPDGVIRLSGYRRTPRDLLHLLFAAVYQAPGYRPDRPRLLELLRDVGAIVVLDDIEFGGTALEELVASVPECAFLISATPDVAAPTPDSLIEEVFLPGLTRTGCLELLERAVDRPLDDEEAAWAADLWFESEGLPLRFVQAAALLRRREARRAELAAEVVHSDVDPFGKGQPADADPDAGAAAERAERDEESVPVVASAMYVPLPSLAQSAAPAERLASELSPSAREVLRFAVALAGECPNPGHLPALVGDTHADAALAELVSRGLAVPVAAHYRLAAGVRTQLADLEPPGNHGRTAAQHFAWWAGHPSVGAERVAAESETLLAAMAVSRDLGEHSSAVLLARTAAPAFAAALHWSAWERALRAGQEAARLAGEVAEEAYFHHELGVLALCTGNPDRARAELDASIALRGALADRHGTAVGRRTLAMLTDGTRGFEPDAAGESGAAFPLAVRSEAPTDALPLIPGAGPPAMPISPAAAVIRQRLSVERPDERTSRIAPARGSRRNRNLVAVGAGVLLATVLGAVMTLGSSPERGGEPRAPMNVVPADSDPGPDWQPDAPVADSSSPKPKSPSPSPSRTSSPSQGYQPRSPERSPSSSHRPTKQPTSGRPSPSVSRSHTGSPSGSPSGSSPSPTTSPSPPSSPIGGATGGDGGNTAAGGTGEPTGGSLSPSQGGGVAA